MKKIDIPLEKVREEYLSKNMCDDDRIEGIRGVLRGLELAEQNIIILYCETGSYSALSRYLRCSVPTAKKKIKEIIEKIRKRYDNK